MPQPLNGAMQAHAAYDRRLSCEVRARIGVEIAAAREAGVAWKELMRRYRLGRTRLWMLWRAALSYGRCRKE